MRLGLLADIHERAKRLRNAVGVLQRHGAERFVVLGDVFETGGRMEETAGLLRQAQAVGVWGNHDVGLCFDPGEKAGGRYSAAVLSFMGGLRPRLEIGDCLFTHVEPWLDPHKVEDLWYFEGPPDSAEKLARSFAAVPHRLLFIGHMHRWFLGTPDGLLPWRGRLRRAWMSGYATLSSSTPSATAGVPCSIPRRMNWFLSRGSEGARWKVLRQPIAAPDVSGTEGPGPGDLTRFATDYVPKDGSGIP